MSKLSKNGTLEEGVLFLNADSTGSLERGGAETKTRFLGKDINSLFKADTERLLGTF